jgi:hypothetical protein
MYNIGKWIDNLNKISEYKEIRNPIPHIWELVLWHH